MWNDNGISGLYDAVFYRKSVRSFSRETLDTQALDELSRNIVNLASLAPGLASGLRILSAEQVKGVLSAKAPHFLAAYAEKDGASLMNAAFRLQQMDLLFASLGLGACWLGMTRPVKEMASFNGLPFAVMLAFGNPDGYSHRFQASEFNRKTLAEITDIDCGWLTEPVRLAPSAVNRQPWYLSGNENAVRLYCKRSGAVSKMIFDRLECFDMGIALCHLWLAAAEHGRFSSFDREDAETVKKLPGFEYVRTVRLE